MRKPDGPGQAPGGGEAGRGARKINWYPGHMARTQRLLQEQLSRVDLAIELCDARAPQASRNPALRRMLAGKKRLLVLGKSDLADERETRRWLGAYRRQGEECLAFDSVRGKAKDVVARAQAACREEVARMAARGVRKTVRVLVVGIPNVGKSTFVNRIKGMAVTKTGDRPGVTRQNQWVRVTPWLELLDTPGLLWPDLEDQRAAERLCWMGTIGEQAIDPEELAISLLEELMRLCPEAAVSRFRIRNPEAEGRALLEEACRGRGWILAGGACDEARGAAVILDEFRAGRLGRLTLEHAPLDEGTGAPSPEREAAQGGETA